MVFEFLKSEIEIKPSKSDSNLVWNSINRRSIQINQTTMPTTSKIMFLLKKINMYIFIFC